MGGEEEDEERWSDEVDGGARASEGTRDVERVREKRARASERESEEEEEKEEVEENERGPARDAKRE